MLLTTDECISTLNTAEQIGIDGTYKSTPPGFYQIVTVNVVKHHLCNYYMILCSQILLPNKERQTYIIAFQELLKLLKPAKDLCLNVMNFSILLLFSLVVIF